MTYSSTRNPAIAVPLAEAALAGLAPDGGLYIPTALPQLPSAFFTQARWTNFADAAYALGREFLRDDIPEESIRAIADEAITFDAPLIPLDETTYALELFHGPTLAFKDIGARFMARLLAHLRPDADRVLTILVATSGDTGSAVAAGFLNVPGIRVVILYPSGGVSPVQERMLTTLGGNVTALEIRGTFDDCQRLVKQAFADQELRQQVPLSSANSINIARLLPQAFAYAYAYRQLIARGADATTPVVVSVPSGNLGHLTAGLMAKRMGLPIRRFIAACNANAAFADYLATGMFTPRPSVRTLANAMDVGNPSNIERILALYGHDADRVRADVWATTSTDAEIRAAIVRVHAQHRYVFDPHGAAGYAALARYRSEVNFRGIGIVVATAHPAKFPEAIAEALGTAVDIPDRMRQYLDTESQPVPMDNTYDALRAFLLHA